MFVLGHPVCVVCRMKTAEKQYIEAFEDELSSFLLRVRQRAQVRVENAMKEAEEVGKHVYCWQNNYDSQHYVLFINVVVIDN